MEEESIQKNSLISRFEKGKDFLNKTNPLTKYYVLLGIVALIASVLSIFYFILSSNLKRQDDKTATKENITVPYIPSPAPLATGPQTYEISGSKKGAPKITRATVDPIDPSKNSSQNWQVEVIGAENGPVREVTLSLFTDNGKERFPLYLSEGAATNGVWQGAYKIHDSYNYTYVAVLRARNEAGKIHKVDLVLR